MRIVLDTNVFVSAVFFGGLPDGSSRPGATVEFSWYFRPKSSRSTSASARFSAPTMQASTWSLFWAFLRSLPSSSSRRCCPEPASVDPDDDKFLACALSAGVSVLVSGDRHLLEQSGWRDVRVIKPRQFVDEFLERL